MGWFSCATRERCEQMKVKYRFANLDDIDELVRLRTLMQFEVNHSDDKTVPDAFTQKVKNYFLKSIHQNKYYSSVAVSENRIVANAGLFFMKNLRRYMEALGLLGM